MTIYDVCNIGVIIFAFYVFGTSEFNRRKRRVKEMAEVKKMYADMETRHILKWLNDRYAPNEVYQALAYQAAREHMSEEAVDSFGQV